LDAMGRTHNAIVASDLGMRQAILSQAIQSGTQKPVLAFFADEHAALKWLNACGFASPEQ
jgi:hypothetical protein